MPQSFTFSLPDLPKKKKNGRRNEKEKTSNVTCDKVGL